MFDEMYSACENAKRCEETTACRACSGLDPGEQVDGLVAICSRASTAPCAARARRYVPQCDNHSALRLRLAVQYEQVIYYDIQNL